ncbi:hypothetical protein [Zoogloea sp.]|uniref:hypothetical protein n=1 Tax=Zoogloea sp. TaxID=49181 RepID=UPI001ACE9B27|nr:hypothetical protein [Zoogloea sp.]MBN8282942.1 hypothetical protein [Zoogloea sp.]
MRTPSRFMPQFPQEGANPFLKWVFAVGFFGVFAALIVAWPLVWGPLVAAMAVGIILEKRRLRRLANAREGESICTFARSIGAKKLDTHVVRAVYEELGKILGTSGSKFPLRPTDQLYETSGLNLDPDDLDELLVAIAFRSQRSLENTESNPYYDKVKTVADLVQFVMAQPVMPNA